MIPLDNVQGRSGRHRSRRDDDVIVLSDDNLSDRDALLVRGESNYVRVSYLCRLSYIISVVKRIIIVDCDLG